MAPYADHLSCKILQSAQPGSFALHIQSDFMPHRFSQRPPTWFTAVWLYFLNAKVLHSVELGPRLNTFRVCVPWLGVQFNLIHLLYWVQSQLGKSLAKISAKLRLTCAPCAQFSVYDVSVEGGVGCPPKAESEMEEEIRWWMKNSPWAHNFIMWVKAIVHPK